MVDRLACAPANAGWVPAPRQAVVAGAVSGGVFGAAIGAVGVSLLATLALIVATTGLTAVPLTWEMGPYSDFPDVATPKPASEIRLIETFADTKVIGLAINHEDMTVAEVTAAIAMYEVELGIPATDALTGSPDLLVDMVLRHFPQLDARVAGGAR